MTDVVSPALLNGVGVVGLLVGLFWMLATGRLVTRREADAIERRAESAEQRAAEATAQLTEMMEFARLGKQVINALDEGAKAP